MMPRFVILAHDWPAPHWDLLLEDGPVLKAWRLLAEPGPGRTVPACPNFDHRLMYLEYEGPLTGERGRVTRWDTGSFTGTPGIDEWEIELEGLKLRGPAELRRRATGWVFTLR